MPREYTLKSFRAPVELNIDYEAELNAQQKEERDKLFADINCSVYDKYIRIIATVPLNGYHSGIQILGF